ncbi:MAG: MraY family glycosyltransferase [Ardenticatenaceae bacterium]
MLSVYVIVLVAFVLALLLTPLTMWLVGRYGVTRVKKMKRVQPYVGGLVLVLAFVAAAWLSRFMPVPFLDSDESIRFQGLLMGVSLALLFGMLHDYHELPEWWIMPFVLGGIAVSRYISIEVLPGGIVLPWVIMIPLTMLWFVGIINTVNSLDGLDGLALGVVGIASGVLAVQMYRDQQYSIALLALALVGVAFGVLLYNFYPVRTLIGSSGTHFLGYVLAALAIMGGARIVTLFLVLSLPILDTGWYVVSRLTRGKLGDSRPLYHRLVDSGFAPQLAVLFYWGISALCGGLLLFLPGAIYKVAAILFVVLLDLILRWLLPRPSVRHMDRALVAK